MRGAVRQTTMESADVRHEGLELPPFSFGRGDIVKDCLHSAQRGSLYQPAISQQRLNAAGIADGMYRIVFVRSRDYSAANATEVERAISMSWP